jgi:hypothetical protein
MRIGPLARGAFAAALMLVCTVGCSGSSNSTTTDTTDAGTGVPQIAAPTSAPTSWDVAMNGPFHVGYRTVQTTYTTPNGATRSFDLNIWYPTLDDDGTTPKYNDIFYDSKAYVDASLAPSVYAGARDWTAAHERSRADFGPGTPLSTSWLGAAAPIVYDGPLERETSIWPPGGTSYVPGPGPSSELRPAA